MRKQREKSLILTYFHSKICKFDSYAKCNFNAYYSRNCNLYNFYVDFFNEIFKHFGRFYGDKNKTDMKFNSRTKRGKEIYLLTNYDKNS